MSGDSPEPREVRGRRVLGYGTGDGGGAFPWWVFIGPVSIVCLWLRVWGWFPFPQGGRTWHRHEGTMLAWAFFTVLISFLAFGIERVRLGDRLRMPGWAFAVLFLGFVANAVTFLFLMLAVAAAHPR